MTESHHTAEHWAKIPRSLTWFTVKGVKDHGDGLEINQSDGWTFFRSKADLGREICVGESLALETVRLTQITGLRDRNGWLFHLTDQDLADEAREFSEKLRRDDVVRLEKHRKQYAEQEAALPEWLRARIRRFREAAGEKFLREGWGYELTICRLADLMEQGRDKDADQLASDEGVTGNQWGCAELLVRAHRENVVDQVPAGIAPITGSADYS
jgi:hypothetical protein